MMLMPRRFTFKSSEDGKEYVGHVSIDKDAMDFRLLAMWIKDDGYPVGVIYNREDVVRYFQEGVWEDIKPLGDLEVDFSKSFLEQVEVQN